MLTLRSISIVCIICTLGFFISGGCKKKKKKLFIPPAISTAGTLEWVKSAGRSGYYNIGSTAFFSISLLGSCSY